MAVARPGLAYGINYVLSIIGKRLHANRQAAAPHPPVGRGKTRRLKEWNERIGIVYSPPNE